MISPYTLHIKYVLKGYICKHYWEHAAIFRDEDRKIELKIVFLFTEFSLRYKKEHEEWKHMELGSSNRSYTASRLLCGTSYKFVLNAQNKHGDSPDSNVVSAKTNGSSKFQLI